MLTQDEKASQKDQRLCQPIGHNDSHGRLLSTKTDCGPLCVHACVCVCACACVRVWVETSSDRTQPHHETSCSRFRKASKSYDVRPDTAEADEQTTAGASPDAEKQTLYL